MKYQGSCHCGDIQFDVEAPEHLEVEDCNCSICNKSGFLHLILPIKNFTLTKGKEHLTEYRFNTKIAKHYFCKTCGIKPFYIPRSNPDGIDINVRCLEPMPTNMTVEVFDGQNWEQNADKLAHKSKG